MKPSKSAVLSETLARQAAPTANKVELSADFPQQNEFVNHPARFLDVQCSRRAGKSNGLALRFFKTMEKYPKSQCLYLASTQEAARGIMWPILNEINDKYKIGCRFRESNLEIVHPNGAKLKLMGADLKDFIKRLKGRKYPGVAIDEAQDLGAHLQSLVDDVLSPAISDYADGWLALTGTPGPVPFGYFFEVTKERKHGYQHFEWTAMDNPHMPNWAAFLADIKAKREWTDDNPTYRREYLNQWVLDVQSLWIRYNEKVNHFTDLPKEHKFNYVMGVDIGFNDADAIAVLAWSETTPITYLVEECLTRKQGLTELANQIIHYQKKYDVSKIVIDEGGLGKKLAEEVRRRHHVPLEPADKLRKQENVELLNDALRLGKFKAPVTSQFAKDSFLVQIDWDKSTPTKIVVKKKPHSDIIDAVLYAFKESWGFAHQPEAPKPRYGSKEWAEAQSSEMFEKELEGYKNALENEKELWGEGGD